MAYETWVGPTYLSGLAGELGVGVGVVALITSLPWIGSIGQLIGAWAYGRTLSVKSYTLRLALAARALWILPLFFAAYWGFSGVSDSLGSFPTYRWFIVVAAVSCSSSLLASSSAVAWMSWMRGLIPSSFHGRFFGFRQRYVMGALIIANLLAAMWVGWKPQGYWIGYAVICTLALISALMSTWLLSKVPDVKISTSVADRKLDLWAPLRDPRFRDVLFFGAMFHGAIQLAGPYFPYYFTKELGIPMSSIALWITLTNLGCFIAAGAWGKKLDRSQNPISIIWWMGHLVALSPLPYLFSSADTIRWIAPVEYFFNGMAWTGYWLAMTSLLFRSCPEGKNAAYFSVYTAACGVAGAFGTFVGGNLAQALTQYGGFRALWAIAAIARLTVLWSLHRRLLRDRNSILPSLQPV